MVLDTSVEEIPEKEPLSREAIITTVPEYAREIYANLREAEVGLSEFKCVQHNKTGDRINGEW